jgi:hypothetical protein
VNVSADVSGVPELVSACTRVAAVLTDPGTAADAAATIAAAGTPPRDTGALQASETITPTVGGARLDYTARHALPVHIIRPWLPAAIAAAETHILELYTDRATAAWS